MRTACLILLAVLASVSRCDPPGPPAPPAAEPKPGESVRIRGRLDADVDCRLLRTEDGKVYSLTGRLPNWRDGTRVCVFGTIALVPSCIHSPGIEVDEVRQWSSCP
jgi:hypothetical protein